MADISIVSLFWAFIGGVVPTFLWLWFWFNQVKKPESTGFLSLLYILGMLSVMIVFPIDTLISQSRLDQKEYLLAFALVEEVVKVALTAVVAFRTKRLIQPADYTLFLVTLALGFSALENTLYLIQPISENNISFILFTGNLRFIGATLLHTTCVAIVGNMLGIAYYEGKFMKWVHGLFGLGLAIGLHAVFNYFILLNTTRSIMIGLAGLWFIGIIVIVIFGRIQKLQGYRTQLMHSESLSS
jgi:RsiW-degrading membrane proteinase PrsW (M82 family)